MNKMSLVVISNELIETTNGARSRMQLGLENHVSLRHEGEFLESSKELYFEDGDEDLIGVGSAGSLSKTMMSYFGYFAPSIFARVPKGTRVEVTVTSISAVPYTNKDGERKASMTINGEMTLPAHVLLSLLTTPSASKSTSSPAPKKKRKGKKVPADKVPTVTSEAEEEVPF